MHPTFHTTIVVRAGSPAADSLNAITQVTPTILQAAFAFNSDGKRDGLPIYTGFDVFVVDDPKLGVHEGSILVSSADPYLSEEDREHRRLFAQARYDAVLPKAHLLVLFNTSLSGATISAPKGWQLDEETTEKLDSALIELAAFTREYDQVGFDAAYDALDEDGKKRIMDLWFVPHFQPDLQQVIEEAPVIKHLGAQALKAAVAGREASVVTGLLGGALSGFAAERQFREDVDGEEPEGFGPAPRTYEDRNWEQRDMS